MPLLGLFSKRHKIPHSGSVTSSRESTDGDYVLPDRPPPPIYNLPASASSSKLKLPFRRKPHVARPDASDQGHPVVSLNDPRISSITSDPGHGLLPPPHKSSLFGVYNNSHHSLPNEPSSHTHSDTPTRLSCTDVRPPPANKKSPGLFSWSRERTKSKPPPPSSSVSSTASTSPTASDSFNLRSFRHVGADSSAVSPEMSPQPSSNLLLPPARPRPRDNSSASDASHRISIAAFREAQARSRTNSPVSSFRPPSTADTLRADANGRKRASTVSVVSGNDRQQTAPPMPSPRPGSAVDTSSDSESSEDDEEVDSDGEPIPKPARRRTITRRAEGIRARSDAGHGPGTTSTGQPSRGRQDPQKSSPATPRSDQAPFTRTRASASTSALTPSSAARRASILAAANSASSVQSRVPPHNPKKVPDESTDFSDDSEDMPLSDLVPPRRPGSSASNQSNSRPRIPAKPLIDINSLAGGQPVLKPILRHRDSVKNMKPQEQGVEKDQPFSIPAALAQSSSTSPSISASASKSPLTPMQHRRFSGEVPKSEAPDDDDDLMMNAIRLVGALDREQDEPSGPIKPSGRIVPTPIREREPPTSFTVLSRPHRQSTAETSASLSPVSQTHSVTTPTVSPHSEPGTRPRAPSMTKSPDNDKSDAISIASVARSSASRSARIPPVPLIHSIPDSPSVKEDYKPGRPRSASRTRTSAANPSEGRSQPPPVPVMPSAPNKMLSHGFKPSLMPHRPFASDRSVRGESPAGSSTGDSSSGRAPFTPRDGSDIGVRSKDDVSDMDSTLKARGHAKKPSVTFEDTQPARGRERGVSSEERTRERRRSEAKAAIELGKIVNGRGPLVQDDSDEDVPRGRNPTINVTMENGHGRMPSWAPWQQPMGTGGGPMVAPPFGNDPTYLAAHQRALLIAKQAYQMAVAQHAMQMAGEEWERSSNAGFGSGGSVYGGGGGGSAYGGSVYGGGSGGSVYGGGAPMNMMGMNMGMLMPPNQWGGGSVAFPGGPASVYGGIGSSQSEYGGRGGGWGARSAYGDSFGSSSRASYASNGQGGPSSAASAYGGSARPRASTGVAPPSTSRTPGKSQPRNRAAPPSSWKSGR